MAEDKTLQPSMDQQSTRNKLKKLIDRSAALKSLPLDARKTRIDLMMTANPETMLRFIDVFEREQAELKKIDEAFSEDVKEIEKLLDEAKQLEKEAEREIRKAEENEERETEVSQAEDLLKKLDEIQDEQE